MTNLTPNCITNSTQLTFQNLGSRVGELELYKLKLPFYVTNYTCTCPNAVVDWSTVSANPSNINLQRIWNITLSSVVKKDTSQYVFTFLPTDGTPLIITFENELTGVITYNGGVYDANEFMTYSYVPNEIFTLTLTLPDTFVFNKILQFNIWIKDNVGSGSTTFPWGTTSSILTNVGNNVQLRGFSLTGTEYISSLYPYDTFYDFTNNCITENFVNFLTTMVEITNNTNTIPALRIPMCADYFLAGSATTPTACNVAFTATQYQQMIIDLIAAATSSGSTFTVSTTTASNYGSGGSTELLTVTGVSNAVIILDLHWNFSTEAPKQSANGTSGANFNSGQQLPLPGVFVSDGTTTNSVADNTLDFWTTMGEIFGVNSTGTSLFNSSSYPSLNMTINYDVFTNIFFELYNEPYIDQLTTDSTGGYVNYFAYLQYYQAYINGGEYYLQGSNTYSSGSSTNSLYSFTGLGTIFCTLRQTVGAYNVCIFGGSEQYSWMNVNYAYSSSNPTDQPGQFNYANGGSNGTVNPTTSETTIYNTYNCFTCLMDAITNTNTNSGTTNQVVITPGGSSYFSAQEFNNCMMNLHPYCGLYSGATKAPGLYNIDGYGTYNALPGFGQMLYCLQNSSFNNFYVPIPIICTEFGTYDLPWSAYYGTASSNPLTYCYNVSGSDTATINGTSYTNPNITYPNPPNYGVSTITLGTPYYTGNWISSATGNLVFGPPVIGYLEDINNFNVNFCIWAWRPNEGGNGNGYNYNQSSTYGWSATNPDIVSGTYSTPGNYITSADGTFLNSFVTSSTQSQTQDPEFTYGSITNDPYNGMDFQYIFNNYF